MIVAAVVLAVPCTITGFVFAFAFSFSCGGFDTQPPPSPSSPQGWLCASDGGVELLMFGLPPFAIAVAGAISAARRRWSPLLHGTILALVVLALSFLVFELPRD